MKRTAILSAILLCVIAPTAVTHQADARKIKTSHKIRKEKTETDTTTRPTVDSDAPYSMLSDTSSIWNETAGKIRFYGFDKTAGSNTESFFITNGLDSVLTAVSLDIVYFDMKGRQLHRRNVEMKCDVAPGETMRHDIKSWDTQKSFYFHQSAKPRRQATPFDVKIELKAIRTGRK